MENIFLLIFLQGIMFGSFCAYVASEKKRDALTWFFLGLLFSIVALLAIIGIPHTTENNVSKTKQKKPSFSNKAKVHEVNMDYICYHCGAENPNKLPNCPECGKLL
jgi:uncharacterized membrane protein